MVGEGYLENDFNMASTGMITVENMTTADTLKLKADLEQGGGRKERDVDQRHSGRHHTEGNAASRPAEIFYNDSGATMMLVQFENPSADKKTMEAQHAIKAILQKKLLYRRHVRHSEDTKTW